MFVNKHSMDSLRLFVDRALQQYANPMTMPGGPVSIDETALPSIHDGDIPPVRHISPETEHAWKAASQVFEKGEIVSGIVTGWNRGGLLVRWDELQGFVPASQLKEMPVFEDDDSRDEKLSRWVGEELGLKVIELDRSRNRLVFSERATIWGPKDGDTLLSDISAGEIRAGHISNLCDFGAFVDLGGVDGLIHISEISWGRVSHPRDMLEIGQDVRVYVISVDRENRRVALSLKRLVPDPWSVVEEKYAVGQVTMATITNLVDFGAFARLEEGLEGLIHLSELCAVPVSHPSQVVNLGEDVSVRVLRIDSTNHRLGLSMRQAADESFDRAEQPRDEPDASPMATEWGNGETLLY